MQFCWGCRHQVSRGASIGSLSDVQGEKARHFKSLNLCHDWLASFLPHALTKIGKNPMMMMMKIRRIQNRVQVLPRSPVSPLWGAPPSFRVDDVDKKAGPGLGGGAVLWCGADACVRVGCSDRVRRRMMMMMMMMIDDDGDDDDDDDGGGGGGGGAHANPRRVCVVCSDRVTFGIMTDSDHKRALEAEPFMPRTR
jgi:hypothetical protein